jgi:hypothetical protein
MTLTSEQAKLLKSGSAVPLTIEQMPCVVVRKDVFDKLSAIEYDDSDWTDEEKSLLAARTFAELDQAERIP